VQAIEVAAGAPARPDGQVDDPCVDRVRRPWWRTAASVAAWVLCAALVAVLWPASLGGWSSATVVSGQSMEPALSSGDVVIGWRAGAYDVGDVIVYEVPDGDPGEGRKVVHRVVAVDGGRYLTEGDNKTSVDPWEPDSGDVVGAQVFVVPGALRWLRMLPFLLAALTGLLVAVMLWPEPRRDSDLELEPDHQQV
jgi:signal peptidase